MGKTLCDKLYEAHLIDPNNADAPLLFADLHMVFEVTSPQAFEGIRNAGRSVRRVDCTLATVDHNVPTDDRSDFKDAESFIKQSDSRNQVLTLEKNVKQYGITYFGMADRRQGIVHVVGPEQGFTLPGSLVVCGDSHTCTHGAFGALAFGIGTSEVEHVLATQTLPQTKPGNMKVCVEGELGLGVSAKDIILHLIGKIGTAGATGCVIEYCGSTIRNLSMEARMVVCNMSVEAGGRSGIICPDDKTFAYLQEKPLAPKGDDFVQASAYWKTLCTDKDAKFDSVVDIDAKDISPTVTWGTSPQDVVPITGCVPDPEEYDEVDPAKANAIRKALDYMGLEPNVPMVDVKLDRVFIGSCTNSRIEDIRLAASVIQGRKVSSHVVAIIVPGSGLVRHQAEKEKLDRIFKEAGFDWREAGCSMCLGMNPDILLPGERCASTSNRNYEGRQGPGGRTHLCSPVIAAASAIKGYLCDAREFLLNAEFVSPTADIIETNEAVQNVFVESQIEDILNDIPTQSSGAIIPPEPEAAATMTSDTGIPKFGVCRSIAAPLEIPDVNTGLLVPAKFLKTTKRTGLERALFHEIRYRAGTDDEEVPDFVLNREPYRHAQILVNNGANFGCGSSREHAVWAFLNFGIRCVIASSFADIFYNNSLRNGLLVIRLPIASQLNKVHDEAVAGNEIQVDLLNQTIRDNNGSLLTTFEIDPFRKHCLLKGLDDIGITLMQEDKIISFERRQEQQFPWILGRVGADRVPSNKNVGVWQNRTKLEW